MAEVVQECGLEWQYANLEFSTVVNGATLRVRYMLNWFGKSYWLIEVPGFSEARNFGAFRAEKAMKHALNCLKKQRELERRS